ncbi:Pm3 [Hordeum vulgare]|nr:Pm3 [Hordeum vulgare]
MTFSLLSSSQACSLYIPKQHESLATRAIVLGEFLPSVAMAEVLATMAIRPLVSMLRDKAASYRLDEYKVMKGMEEQHKTLKRKLPAILDLCLILQAVEVLIAEMQDFVFKYQPQPPVSREWRHTDYVIIDPQKIARESRYKEMKEIVDTLLGGANNEDLAVVPVIGMGGLGKTTSVQLIYNDPEIQKYFQLLLWVCVSRTFDVNYLAKSIVEASPNKNVDTDKSLLDRLQKLGSLQSQFFGGSLHKKIIESTAFTLDKEKPAELVEIVDEIVKRCCGSPLAATALVSVLRTKTSVEEWKAISSRSSICTDETGILPILKLSYNDLPAHMKQCFAFCVVFPKDYKINVEKLIQLWIANGCVPEHKEDSLETFGKHIFDELVSSDVAELHISNTGGHLGLCQVENVEKAEAEVANLGNKKDLSEVTLRCTSVCVNKVLDNFEPHGGLQVLRTYSYGGECMVMAFKPKTWKEIPRLVRERRAAALEARKCQQAMQE